MCTTPNKGQCQKRLPACRGKGTEQRYCDCSNNQQQAPTTSSSADPPLGSRFVRIFEAYLIVFTNYQKSSSSRVKAFVLLWLPLPPPNCQNKAHFDRQRTTPKAATSFYGVSFRIRAKDKKRWEHPVLNALLSLKCTALSIRGFWLKQPDQWKS